MKISDIQGQLAARGYTPGPIDGIWGRKTVAALRTFQRRHDLEPDGILGPISLLALFDGTGHTAGDQDSEHASALDDPQLVWLQEARRLLGTKEVPGAGSNPTILDWATDQGSKAYRADETPWCGLFVGHCIASTLDLEPMPSNILSARSWERFGVKTSPCAGAVMVFWRRSRSSGLGHVGFYAGEDETAYRILGGNQSDSVSLAWISKDRWLDARWPSTVPPIKFLPVVALRTDILSWNES